MKPALAPPSRAPGQVQPRALLPGEDVLRDHAVHALADVDHLRHAAVAHDRGEQIGFGPAHRHRLLLGEEIHRLARGVHHRLVEVLVEAGGDPVGARLEARPFELHVLAHDRLQHDLLVGALQAGEAHLAVALAAMRVAGPDQPALDEHRDEDLRTGLQLVDVHVGAVLPRPQRRHRRPRTAAGVRLAQLDDLLHRDALLHLVVRMHHGLDRDSVAGVDGQLRRLLRIEPAPLHGLERRRQRVMLAALGGGLLLGDRAAGKRGEQRREKRPSLRWEHSRPLLSGQGDGMVCVRLNPVKGIGEVSSVRMSEQDAIALTRALLRFETVNPPGRERDCARHAGALLARWGYRVEYHEYAEARTSVIARAGGSPSTAPLCLPGHLDVVPLGARAWTRDPFAGETQGDRLYGRGSSDMKAGVAAMLLAAKNLARKISGTPGIVLVLTAAEEGDRKSVV